MHAELNRALRADAAAEVVLAPEPVAPPVVTVLMTTFNNAERTLCQTIDCVLAQTFRDFEFIIVFEPGDRNATTIRARYHDPRLIIVENQKRMGRSMSYNLGLSMSRGRYLARMDADDISPPDRLEKQIAFLRARPEISVVSSSMRLIDESGREVGVRRFPCSHRELLKAICYTNPMSHPGTMWDWERVGRDLRFDLRFSAHCDDLELWLRLMEKGHKFANLPDVLVDYRQTNQYRRSRENWRYNFRARLLHWRMTFKRPSYALGMVMVGLLSSLPSQLIDRLTARNPISDAFRRIRA